MPFPKRKKDFYEKSRPEKLVSTLNNMSFTDMDKFEKEKTMKKRPLVENTTWYDWLINYISNPIKEQWGCPKDGCQAVVWSSFKFIGSSSIRRDEVNKPKESSYIELRKWLGFKNATRNLSVWFYSYTTP